MQSGGGRGDSDLAGFVSVDGLVAGKVLVAARAIGALNVGRQGDVAEPIGNMGDGFIARCGQVHEGGAVVVFGHDFSGECSVDMGKRGTDRKFFAGAHQATPHAFALDRAKPKALDLSARRSASMQARRQDGGVVTKKNVARTEELREVGKRVVGHTPRRPIYDKETGLISPRGGRLGDQMRWERIVEEIGGERCHDREREMNPTRGSAARIFPVRGQLGAPAWRHTSLPPGCVRGGWLRMAASATPSSGYFRVSLGRCGERSESRLNRYGSLNTLSANTGAALATARKMKGANPLSAGWPLRVLPAEDRERGQQPSDDVSFPRRPDDHIPRDIQP